MIVGTTHALGGKFEVEAMSTVVVQFQPIDCSSVEEVDQNVDKIIDYMERATFGFPGYDLIIFPECALQGYSRIVDSTLLDMDSQQIRRIQDKCRELMVWAIVNPYFKEIEGKPICNTVIIINDQGEIVHKYVKMNTWAPGETAYPGWEMPVTPGPKGSRIATMICADGDYSEMYREAAYNGANIIVRVAHYPAPWDNAWEITNKAGAYFNQCYVIGCNAIGDDCVFPYFGDSMIVNPDGNVITQAPKGVPWILKADLFPQIVDKMREKMVTSNFLYAFKHRGASNPEFQGYGDTTQRYNAYQDPSIDNRRDEHA